MARTHLKLAEGIFLRRQCWWIRFSFGGKQVRASLETRNELEAIQKAEIFKKNYSRKIGRSDGWEKAIKRYLVEKLQNQRPEGYVGMWRTFRPKTAKNVGYILRAFANWSGTKGPTAIKLSHLEKYHALHKKNSEAGGKTIIATVQAFLGHVGCLPGKVQLPPTRELESRELAYTTAQSNKFIDDTLSFVRRGRGIKGYAQTARALAVQQDLNLKTKFVLCCGFWAGLRANEIRHAKPRWFNLSRGILRVPARDGEFLTKDRESREIPLGEVFRAFLKEYLKGKAPDEFVLKNTSGRRSKDGTWDFKRPVKAYMDAQDEPDFYPHAMRHSWITELINSGNHTLQEVSAWSGDGVETIEKNYWKKRVVVGSIDATLRGENIQTRRQKEADSREQLQRQMETVSALMESRFSTIQNLLEEGRADEATKLATEFKEMAAQLNKLDGSKPPDRAHVERSILTYAAGFGVGEEAA